MNYQRQMIDLKMIARDLGVEPTGDRRKRETWEQAIAHHQFFSVPQTSDTSDISPGVGFEPVMLSDRFLAIYTPSQPEIHYQIEADGQLSLFDFVVEQLEQEPPDPDDFEFLDTFHEAIALWDTEHPLDVSLDSFTYWAPCPDDWFEPAGENFPGVDRVQALLKSFSTSDFFILVLGRDRLDEPPTAGVGARLPKPKPPSFSPTHTKRIPNAYQTHICFVSTRASVCLGRSPPGGDVMR